MNNTVLADMFDDWDNAIEAKASDVLNPPKSYLSFNTPPLALTLAMMDYGKYAPEIVDLLSGVDLPGLNLDVQYTPTEQHHVQAATIYKYFSNKHTMRRLKGEFISEWMLAVEDLCDNRKRIDKKHLPILVTLPKFYQTNLELESLIREHKSVPKSNTFSDYPLDETVEFVKKIERRAVRSNHDEFYWKTSNNQLVMIRTDQSSLGTAAWDFIASQGKIRITSDFYKPVRIQGYEFYVMQPVQNTKVNNI